MARGATDREEEAGQVPSNDRVAWRCEAASSPPTGTGDAVATHGADSCELAWRSGGCVDGSRPAGVHRISLTQAWSSKAKQTLNHSEFEQPPISNRKQGSTESTASTPILEASIQSQELVASRTRTESSRANPVINSRSRCSRNGRGAIKSPVREFGVGESAGLR